ncbi:MAG TPA: DMT family transporter [Steroidobacteraceae bacterium]|nr:DMT family transporter [Steroidobacteraceae bacterium]
MPSTQARPRRGLLVLLIVTWAISWPVIKIGVADVPPLWYACLRYAIATAFMFAVAAARGELAWPPRQDWPLVVISGTLQMAAYSALTGSALTVLPPGRASILAFSTPIWVAPLAACWAREFISRATLIGTSLGLLGVLLIAAPSLRAASAMHASAYAMLIGAALAWAVTIVFVRTHRFAASALTLAPWQMALASTLLLGAAFGLEGAPARIDRNGALSLAFVGPAATAFAYWAVVEAGRHVRASTMAMALLAAPVLGLFISAATLGESIDLALLAGTALIGAGIRLATGPAARRLEPAAAPDSSPHGSTGRSR